MSAVHDSQRPTDEAAMARVLAAERAAREALERSTRQAAEALAQSRARAKAIAATAARRAAAVRASMERRLAGRLAQLDALEREVLAAGEPDRAEHERLLRAVERHATELTGREP